MIKSLLKASLVLLGISCHAHEVALLPKPYSMEIVEGSERFEIPHNWKVYSADSSFKNIVSSLVDECPGMEITVCPDQASLSFLRCDTFSVGSTYAIEVDSRKISIFAAKKEGASNAASTLRQLINQSKSYIPALKIYDKPRFGRRGLMIDCSRHFWTVDELKRLITCMSLFKLNVLHMHLTDNQGWRLDLDSFPEVARCGTYYYDFPERSGQFYLASELSDLVEFADARGIEIVPEIDMPGHCLSLLASRPGFSCMGGVFETYQDEREQHLRKRLGENMICPAKEDVYDFINILLDQVTSTFKSKYIHMGGDEVSTHIWQKCPDCQALYKSLELTDWKGLQDYFTQRVVEMVRSHGKILMGWEEINDRGACGNEACLTVWQKTPEQVMDNAFNCGLDVILCPGDPCYFDYSYSRNPSKKLYAWDPTYGRNDSLARKHILGGQACLWTEFIPSYKDVERMLFPRLFALSEVLWTPADARDWDNFTGRLNYWRAFLNDDGVASFNGENYDNDWFHAEKYDCTFTTPPIPSKIVTNMGEIKGYEKEFAFDGDTTTFYSSPYSHTAGEYFTLELDQALPINGINIITDEAQCHFYDGAELRVSPDGSAFHTVATTDEYGNLRVSFDNQQQVKTISIVLTKAKNSRLNIREFNIF